ncbi:MAG: tetratricopeptide repeat protein [Bacteroidota bacterium]
MKAIFYIMFVGFLAFHLMGCQNQSGSDPSGNTVDGWLALAGDASYGSDQWIAMLDSAILNFPNEAEPYYRKAVRLIRQDDYLGGMQNLTKAAELNPLAYLNYLGLIKLMDLHDFEGAATAFQKAITLGAYNDPIISGNAKLRLGLTLKEMGKFDEAISNITEYINENGEEHVIVYTFIHRGTAYEAIGDFELAASDYEKALSYWPKCTEAYYFLGKLKLAIGEAAAACQNARNAILYKNFIRTNPSRSYTDQIYYTDLEALFDAACQ